MPFLSKPVRSVFLSISSKKFELLQLCIYLTDDEVGKIRCLPQGQKCGKWQRVTLILDFSDCIVFDLNK